MASRVGHYLLFDTLGTGTFAKYVFICSCGVLKCCSSRHASQLFLSLLRVSHWCGLEGPGMFRVDRGVSTDVSCCSAVLFPVLVLVACSACAGAG